MAGVAASALAAGLAFFLCFTTLCFSGGLGIGCMVPDWASAEPAMKAVATSARPMVLSFIVLLPLSARPVSAGLTANTVIHRGPAVEMAQGMSIVGA